MRRAPLIAPLLLFLSLIAWPAKPTAAELKARADSASGGDKIKYALAYAHYCADTAATSYGDGKYEEAHSLLLQAAQYGDVAATTAIDAGKKLKQTEIALREIQSRLVQLKRAVEFEEQGAVQQAIDSVDKNRGQLITKMFGLEASPVEKK